MVVQFIPLRIATRRENENHHETHDRDDGIQRGEQCFQARLYKHAVESQETSGKD